METLGIRASSGDEDTNTPCCATSRRTCGRAAVSSGAFRPIPPALSGDVIEDSSFSMPHLEALGPLCRISHLRPPGSPMPAVPDTPHANPLFSPDECAGPEEGGHVVVSVIFLFRYRHGRISTSGLESRAGAGLCTARPGTAGKPVSHASAGCASDTGTPRRRSPWLDA